MGDAEPGALPDLRGDARPGEFPNGLDDLVKTSGVPIAKRGAFVREMWAAIRFYQLRILVSRQEEPSRTAETLRQGVAIAKQFQRWLASLPVAIRLTIEPEMIGLVHRYEVVRQSSGIIARKRRLPEAEEEPEDVSLPRVVTRKRFLPGGWQMPGFDVPLAELINKAEAEGARQEARISRSWSRRKATYLRNDFALASKTLAMAWSPKFARDARGAEQWVIAVLKELKIRYPDPVARQADFRRMFMPPGHPTETADP